MNCILVILNYRDSERAITLGKKCVNFNVINKVIIVDNNSQDESAWKLTWIKDIQDFEVIFSKKNGGFSYGLNLGIRYAREKYHADYILCANTDTVFEEQDVESCLNLLEMDNRMAVASLRMKEIDGSEGVSNWKLPKYEESLLECFWIYRRIRFYIGKNRKFMDNEKMRYVDVVRGSFMLFRSKIFDEIGYFDENVFMYGEENIICSKIKEVGYRVGLVTDRCYLHNHISKGGIESQISTFVRILDSLIYYYEYYTHVGKLRKKILKCIIGYSKWEWKSILHIKYFIHFLKKKVRG